MAKTTQLNIDSQFTAYKNAMDNRSQQASNLLGTYRNEVDALRRDLNNRRTELQNSSSTMNNALNLSRQIQNASNTVTGLISRATTNITATEQTNRNANNELASIRTKNTQASRDASVTADHLASARKAAADALISKNATDAHRNDAQGFSSSAASLEAQTRGELNKAKETNRKMRIQYRLAQKLLENTGEAITAAGAGAVADLVIEEGQAGFTNLSASLYEGLDNNNLTNDELRILAGSLSSAHRENLSQHRLLQISELLAQKDTVASNILMDYMYKNEKGTNVSTIMDRVGQLNTDKKRKLEISTYYNKSREKYINILKVIVIACIIIVPLVIANKNNMISNPIFMFLAVTIIFFTIIFIFSSLVDIYKRDNVDFDKYNIPYNREGVLLEKEGTLTRKKNPLTSLTLTCIGQDCCDGEMVYDTAKNKCIATENFGNAFETMMANTTKKTIVVPTEGFNNNCNMKNNMLQHSLACSTVDKFMTNECRDNLQMQF